MLARITWIGVALTMILAVGAAQGARKKKPPRYVGAAKCNTCHKKELMGNQQAAWEQGPHAKAFETLKSEEAQKIATEKGISGPPHESAECVKCHVTAYGEDPSMFLKKPLEHQDGVQCESCHGPGSSYRKKKTMASREKSLAAGMWEPEKDEKRCTACHSDESPSWDPATGFDYEAAKEEIAHAIPEDVKGHYLELEKERKAAKGGAGDDEEEDEEE